VADALLVVKILTDASQSAAATQAASGKFGKFGSTMKKMAVPAAAIVAGLGAIGVSAVKSASRTEQAMGGVEAVFGKNANTVKRWAGQAANTIGLAKSEYGELATTIGSQLKNAGIPMDQLAGQTKGLISQGADLAAMYGGTTKDAVDALSSAMKGEFDPMEKYGASLSAAKISAQMAADGTDKLTGKQAAQAKMLATLKLMHDQTKDAEGAAAREHDTTAARTQQLSANIENLKSSLGTKLLPVIEKTMGALLKMANWMQKNQTAVAVVATIMGVLAAAVLAVNVALWLMAAAEMAAFWPIVLIVGAVALLAAGFVLLYRKSSVFRSVVKTVFASVASMAKTAARVLAAVFRVAWSAISAVARTTGAVVRAVFSGLKTAAGWVSSAVRSISSWLGRLRVPGSVRVALNAIKTAASWAWQKVQDLGSWLGRLRVPGAVSSVLNAVKNAADAAIDVVKRLAGYLSGLHVPKLSFPKPPAWMHLSAPVPSASSLPMVAGAGGAGAPAVPMGRAGGGGVGYGAGLTIVIQGAVDPESTARQVKRLLGAHERRVGSARGLRVS